MTTRQAIAWEKLKDLEKYTIYHHTFETFCEWCGCLLSVGDTVFFYDDNTYCSMNCIHQDLQ